MDLAAFQDMTPKESLRFEYVLEQGFDASCGFASAATLLSLYWGLDVTEDSLVLSFFGEAEPEQQQMASLADLARMIQGAGLDIKGFRMTLSQLVKVIPSYAPVVVHYDHPDPHFALVLGYQDNHFVTADPARGVEVLSQEVFQTRWSGAVLLVTSSTLEKQRSLLEKALTVAGRRTDLVDRLARQGLVSR